MGVVDWLKKFLDLEPAPKAKPARAKRATTRSAPKPAARSTSTPTSRKAGTPPRPAAAPAFRPAPSLPDDARWIRSNEQVEFQGIAVRGGLFYIGSRLRTGVSSAEPSLIDPTLPFSLPDGDASVRDLPYWPSYATLSPRERGSYLHWLASGRRDPRIPIGYPFLFLYGIERRLLLDRDRVDPSDLAAIRADLAALNATYGVANESFRAASEQMTGLADLLLVERILADRQRSDPASLRDAATILPPPPPLLPNNRAIPISLRIGLGILALAQAPIPPDWALAWAWYEPTTSIRAAAIRLPDEFAALFAIQYGARFGDGLTVDPARLPRLDLSITPANAALGEQRVRSALLPDVMAAAGMIDLFGLVRIATNALDETSRWLARNPDRAGSLAAWAMLPDALRDPGLPFATGVSAKLAALAGTGPVSIVPGDRLIRLWTGDLGTPPEKLTRDTGANVAIALARLGYGIEPDPRSGVAIAADAPVALFRLPGPPPGDASPEDGAYGQAALLVDLAAIVGEADGAASLPEFTALRDHLRQSWALSPQDDARLGARLAWLAARPAAERTLAGMKRRIAPLSAPERDRLASGLLRVVDADGSVSPAEVTALRTIWKLLGRDPDRVASDLHAVMTGGQLDPTPAAPAPKDQPSRRPKPATPPTPVRARQSPGADDPVIVRRATPETPGVRIPRPPGSVEPAPVPDPDLTLDPTAIARKIADSAAVSALLGDLLAEESPPPVPAPTPARSGTGDPASPVMALLAALDAQETWASEAFAALAEGHGMMPNAALDLLNDLGFEHAGDPLLMEEADGSFRVDPGVLASVRASGDATGVQSMFGDGDGAPGRTPVPRS